MNDYERFSGDKFFTIALSVVAITVAISAMVIL